MASYQIMQCKSCKYYESYHRHPNPRAIAKHWCKKCNKEIKYVRAGALSDYYIVWYPKQCYFNDYFEESDEYKKKLKEQNKGIIFCQVE